MSEHTKEPCTMGVGCDEYGVCYAEAHGQPEQCPKSPKGLAAVALLLDAVDALGLRELVAGWNGENREDGPYEPHPPKLGVTLRTTAGQVYGLDAATEAVRASFAGIENPAAFVQAARVLHRALKGVIDATASYLPPDGISKDDCINRVLAASDNPEVFHALQAFRAATGEQT